MTNNQVRPSDVPGMYVDFLMGGRRNSNPAMIDTELERRMFVREITELATNRFEWKGLPPGVDPRFLELTLFRGALAIFFEADSKKYGRSRFFAMRGTPSGRQDMYDNPTSFNVYGNSFLNRRLTRRQCVPIWANYLREPDWDIVTVYSKKLAEISRSIDIAAMNMRNTNVVFVDEEVQLSMQNFIDQRNRGEMQIAVKKDSSIDPARDIIAIDMKIHPDTLPKLQIAKNKIWNECMTLLGINNANQDKAERLVADEVSANDQQIEATRRIALNSRQYACEQINKRYPSLNVSVDFHVKAAAIQEPGVGEHENGNGDNVSS